MGVVYEALDRETGSTVALKTLTHITPDALYRFKKEFRDFQNLQHPNLVSMGELFSDGAGWFFSMELIEGVSFIDYVRSETADREGSRSSEVRLRDAAIQLAEGLVALHGFRIQAASSGWGHGTSFRIDFPVADTSSAAP